MREVILETVTGAHLARESTPVAFDAARFREAGNEPSSLPGGLRTIGRQEDIQPLCGLALQFARDVTVGI